MIGNATMRTIVVAFFGACSITSSLAQHKCISNGKATIQESPCQNGAAAPSEKQTLNGGKYRCFVDGEVIYSDRSCTTIKSKETLAREAKDAKRADIAKRQADAKRLEAADQSNFSARIHRAERQTARHLRDPDSARFDQSFVSWLSGSAVVCGYVAGKNGFGGYSKPVRFYVIDDLVTIYDRDSSSAFFEDWWKYCMAPYID